MAAEDLDNELETIADAQNGDAVQEGVVKEGGGKGRGARLVHGVGASRENDQRGGVGGYGG